MSPWNPLEERPRLERVWVRDVELRPRARVRLRPRGRADILDMALDGRIGFEVRDQGQQFATIARPVELGFGENLAVDEHGVFGRVVGRADLTTLRLGRGAGRLERTGLRQRDCRERGDTRGKRAEHTRFTYHHSMPPNRYEGGSRIFQIE